MTEKINANLITPRLLAFYLPQFHPIPENNEWWGEGFTEWTNCAKAKPLFKGHYQPRIPKDLGFYDLRLSTVREQQAKMALDAGVEGFVYWHYWFAGKRILNQPFDAVLSSKTPDFPFCLAWANETWSGVWHGEPKRILIEQTYPGRVDYENHFYSMLEAFKDERYIKINNSPLFYIYCPDKIPSIRDFVDCWNELAVKNGLKEFYFVGRALNASQAERYIAFGLNAVQTNWLNDAFEQTNFAKSILNRLSRKVFKSRFLLDVWDYKELIKHLTNELDSRDDFFPTILSGWDNSPRSGKNGRVFINYNPEIFNTHVQNVIDVVKGKNRERNIIFLRSWNEWAEGNYVEPDLKYGRQYLDVIKSNFLPKLEK